ncbi:hypothetical protein CEXT_32921 [Caerostris extrusa]|uniref:Secreted protein n=1 Tax=Caerostris extrusa TaxID=172846 RepID=A0AAV4PLQ0_CAEEX|nr:hypothetical protein CEXT_32921 [Caerostris extrusa]
MLYWTMVSLSMATCVTVIDCKRVRQLIPKYDREKLSYRLSIEIRILIIRSEPLDQEWPIPNAKERQCKIMRNEGVKKIS